MLNLSSKWWIGLALIALSCLVILTLITMEHCENAGVVIVQVTAEINAPRSAVWPWLTQGVLAQRWVTGLLEVRKDSSSTGRIGTKEVWVISDEHMHDGDIFPILDLTRTCTEYAEPSRLSTHLSAPGEFEGDETYQIADLGGGRTRLEVNTHLRYSGWFNRLVRPFIARATQTQTEEDIAMLKPLAETATLPTSAR